MNKTKINIFLSPLIILMSLVLFRIIPHPPNFTPIIAFAVISSYFFSNQIIAFGTLVLSLLVSDFIIGFYDGFGFTYFILFFLLFSSKSLFKKLNFNSVTILLLYGSTAFFIFSNFAVWLKSGMYEHTFDGLLFCYINALPFYGNTLLSTFFYGYLLLFFNASIKKYEFNTN